MSKEHERFVMIETESGEWFKFDHKPQDTFLIDFPNGTVIGVARNISNVTYYLPDELGIYRYAGDVGFKADNHLCDIEIHSNGIESIMFDRKGKVEMPTNRSSISNLSVKVNVLKSKAKFKELDF